MILDIHTHHQPPRPEALVCVSPEDFSPVPDQLYSVGIHPWRCEEGIPDESKELLASVAGMPQVAAIGETGLDILRGGPLFRQINLFRLHVEISERVARPLVIHCVRAHDHIVALHREYKPSMPWIIHGFRGRPAVARILLDEGLWLSCGARYNPLGAAMIPDGRLLAETDESPLQIHEVIEALAQTRSVTPERLTALIAANTEAVLGRGTL